MLETPACPFLHKSPSYLSSRRIGRQRACALPSTWQARLQPSCPRPLPCPPQSLALLDALAGGGDAFWERYAAAVLPQPLELTLPLCFPPELLLELQHGAIIAGARAQQERLAGLFPGLNAPMCEGAAVGS